MRNMVRDSSCAQGFGVHGSLGDSDYGFARDIAVLQWLGVPSCGQLRDTGYGILAWQWGDYLRCGHENC